MNVRYRVELSQAERGELGALLSGGKHGARKLKRAQILLAADVGVGDEEIVRSVGVGGSTVSRTKRRFVLGNLEAALSEEPRAGAARKLSGKRSRDPASPDGAWRQACPTKHLTGPFGRGPDTCGWVALGYLLAARFSTCWRRQ